MIIMAANVLVGVEPNVIIVERKFRRVAELIRRGGSLINPSDVAHRFQFCGGSDAKPHPIEREQLGRKIDDRGFHF